MTKDIFLYIRSSLSGLPASQQKLAEFILTEPSKIISMPIDRLALQCGVSVATISRFCQRLGFSSYQDLKIQLASCISSRAAKESRLLEVFGTGVMDSAKSIVSGNLRCMENALIYIVEENVSLAAEAMLKASRILFFSTIENPLAAVLAFGKFIQSTSKAVCFPDVHMQNVGASMMSENDVAFIISDGQKSEYMLELMALIGNVGSRIFTIYPVENAPCSFHSLMSMVMMFDHSDPFSAGETIQNFIIDTLLVEFIKKTDQNNQ